MAKLKIMNDYGVTPNEILNSKELTFKAKGLFGYIQSKPDGWEFSAKKISSQTKDGLSGVRSGLKELEDKGYLKRVKSHDDKGFWSIDYELHRTPECDYPFVENPTTDNPSAENRINNSKQELSKQEYSKKEEREAKPSKLESSITYLDNLTLEVKREFCEKYNCSISDIEMKAENMKLHCGAKGVRYKNYKMALQTWLLKDYGKKKENHLRFKKEEVLSK